MATYFMFGDYSQESVMALSAERTEKAIERSDISLLLIDATCGITTQDKKIASLLEKKGKGYIILANKWDLVSGFRMEHYKKAMNEDLFFTKNHPILFISAKTRRNVDKIFIEIEKTIQNQKRMIPTAYLNKFIESCIQKYHPPMIRGKRLRIYYLTQKDVSPPRFLLFINKKQLMTKSYEKYLVNRLREEFSFWGVSLVFEMREKTVSFNT